MCYLKGDRGLLAASTNWHVGIVLNTGSYSMECPATVHMLGTLCKDTRSIIPCRSLMPTCHPRGAAN